MKASTKDFFREVKRTFNRYISILAIMALGVAFYAGIRSSEPDMRATAKAYYDDTDFCDIWCAGTMGITEESIQELRAVSKDFTVEGMYYTEAFLKREKRDFQLQIYSDMQEVSRFHVSGGRLPEKDNEVFVDLSFFDSNKDLSLGDTIELYGEGLSDKLKYDSYVVVGYGTYAQFFSWDRGTVSIGNGKADAFIVLSPDAFLTDYYTYAHIRINGAKDYTPFTDDYREFVEGYTDKIEAVKDRICDLRLEEIRKSILEKLDLSSSAMGQGYGGVAGLKRPELMILTRDSIQSAVEFGMDAERIGKIGLVFPAIFFLVATFVSLTTMTRMVEEQRIQIGTYKALGYSKLKIAGKYFWYSVSASLTGGIIGALIGSKVLPFVIISAYKILYFHLPAPVENFQWKLSVFSILLAVSCTVIATMIACMKELSEVAAKLMRPETPKAGRRILLEHIGFIWKKMSFTGKATARNLFRYKKRLFMTIFGIGGCMALLMVGFGLRDSIGDIVTNQYDKIWTYDAELSIAGEAGEIAEGNAAYRNGFDGITHELYIRNESINVKSDSGSKEVQLLIPESLEKLPDFLSLQNRKSKEKYRLEKEGCVISEKLARVLKLKAGDMLTLMNGEQEAGQVEITAIAENYLYYYVYISKDQYLELFDNCQYNKLLLKYSPDMTAEEKDSLAAALLELPEVTAITNISSLRDRVAKMMRSLDLVVVVLIVSAGLLAFIVLYNLNNINILERRRELATIKVLGFYDTELAAYVYRENVWLTVFGVILGCFLGFFLHKFVIETCEIDMIMFGRDIKPVSYLFSAGITFIFAILVNFGMFFRIKKVDMVESLKSAE